MTKKIYTFYDHHNNAVRVETEQQADGSYVAVDADNHDLGMPVGRNYGEIGAIANLRDQMVALELWPASFFPGD